MITLLLAATFGNSPLGGTANPDRCGGQPEQSVPFGAVNVTSEAPRIAVSTDRISASVVWTNGIAKLGLWIGRRCYTGVIPSAELDKGAKVIGYAMDLWDPARTFRNFVAHGKTERVQLVRQVTLAEADRHEYPESTIEKMCTVAKAQRFVADARAMIETARSHRLLEAHR